MADDFLPPLIAILGADVAGYTAGLTEAEARMTAFVESQTAAMAELDARMASMGAGADLGAAAGGAAIDTGATTAAATEMQAENDRIKASFAEVAASAQAMSVEVEASYGAMAARTAELSTAMAAAGDKAAVSNKALGEAWTGSSAKADGFLGKLGMSKAALIGVAAAGIGAAVETVKMAGDFNMATERLVTSAGESQQQIGMVRDGILSMAGAVGYSTTELAQAMYTVESGGQHGAAGLKVLQAAAEGAKTENADLVTVADAVTSVLQDYHLKASDSADVTSKLVAATSQGKTTFEQLAASMSAVLPVASANHVSLNDILGDLASMTVHGMSAQQVTQNLSDTIRHMAAPTQAQSKELAILGINSQQLSTDLGTKGLSGTIQEVAHAIQNNMGSSATQVVLNLNNALKGLPKSVQDLGAKVLDGSMSMKDFTAAAKGMNVISDKQVTSFAALAGSTHVIGTTQMDGAHVMQSYTGALRAAMGDATGLNTALMLTGENTQTTSNAINVVSGATAEAGGHVKGWAEIQAQFNTKLTEAKDGLGALATSIGEKLLPVVTPLIGALATAAQWLAQHKTAATILATVIGSVVVAAMVALTVAFWGWAASMFAAATAATVLDIALAPFIAIVAAVVAGIALLAFAAYELITHWGAVKSFFTGLWDDVKGAFDAGVRAVKTAWDDLVGGFTNPQAAIGKSVSAFEHFFLSIGEWARRAVDDVRHFFSSIGNAIVTPFRVAFDAAKALFSMSPAQLGEALGRGLGELTRALYDFGVRAIRGLIDGVTSGYTAVTTWFHNLPGMIERFFVGIDVWLLTDGRRMLDGFLHGIVTGFQATMSWFAALHGRFLQFTVNAGTWLLHAGQDLLTGLWHGIVAGFNATIAFFVALPGEIGRFFAAAPSWLYQAGSDILSGLWNGFTGFIGTIYHGIADFIGGFIRGFKQGLGIASPSTVMAGIGGDIVRGLWNGVVSLWNGFLGFVGGLPRTIIGMFAGAGEWLKSAGYNLIVGFWNGVQQLAGWVYNQAVSWANSVMNGIKGALGIHSPSTVAAQAGMFLAQGLAQGIDSYAHQAVAAAASMASRVSGALTGASGFTGSITGSALAGSTITTSGGQGGTLQVVVQGNVWTTQDLVKELQTQLLRHDIRNGNAGIAYSFA
ncbi:MAG TPA: phage tail tape measure protein [Pseudonocardiaceae bacterium]